MAQHEWKIEVRVDIADPEKVKRGDKIVARIACELLAQIDLSKLDDASPIKPQIYIMSDDFYGNAREISLSEGYEAKRTDVEEAEAAMNLPAMELSQDMLEALDDVADRAEQPTKR